MLTSIVTCIHVHLQVLHVYSRYFHSMSAITMTTLDILNERVFPFSARSYEVINTMFTITLIIGGH